MDFGALTKTAKRYVRKGEIKARKGAKKAGKFISEKTPEAVKEFASDAKEVLDEATAGVKKSYDLAKKQVADERTAKGVMKELDKKAASGEMSKVTHKAMKDGKPSRYMEDVTYSKINKNTGEHIPEKTVRRVNKKQVAKDAAIGAGVAGAGVAAMAAGGDDEDILKDIRRKQDKGIPLTASEKRLFRLMEE